MSSNFKKQFHRVTQRLDQTLGRSEKSEVLNEEQQNLERRVELIQKICQNVSKKLQSCLLSQGVSPDVEKRMKKIPKLGLSHAFIESSVQLGQDAGAGRAFNLCGDVEGQIAASTLQMELDIEDTVLQPLNDLLEVDYPSIQKLRKQLTSRTLDMDAARGRYGTAFKQVQQSGGSTPGVQSKVDVAREEAEDAKAKVEQTRDQLAEEMYSFVAKESEISRLLLSLVQVEIEFHRRSLESLQLIVPHLQESIEQSVVLPVFGLRLEEHLDHSGREIAVVLEDCIMALFSSEYDGLKEEGLFRLAGGASKMKKLRAAFNSNSPFCLLPEEFHAHVISSVLKQYLRELPEPLMMSSLYLDWMQAAQKPPDQRQAAILNVIDKMYPAYKQNLGYLIKFLAKLAENAEVNKMSASNIALVIGPNLLWAPGETSSNMLSNTGVQASLVETLIANADYFFPGSIDFNVPQTVSTPQTTSSSATFATVSSNGPAGSDAISASPATARGQQLTKRVAKPSADQRPTSWTPSDTDSSSASPRLDRPKAPPPDRPYGAPTPPEKPKSSRETTPVSVTGSSKPPEPPVKPSVYPTKPDSAIKIYPALPAVVDVSDSAVCSSGKSLQSQDSIVGGTGTGASRPPRPQLPPQLRTPGVKPADGEDGKKNAEAKENRVKQMRNMFE